MSNGYSATSRDALALSGPRWTQHGLSGLLRAALDLLFTWQERADQRHALAMLEDYQLRDIGLSRADVAREATKPFWTA